MYQNFSYRLSAALIGAAIVVMQPQVAVTQTVDEQAVTRMAKDVTVVINGQNPGSGVIISRQGNTYYVLTAKHVVATQDQYKILTSDGTEHQLDYGKVKKLPKVDLAVVQFTSNQNYRVAQLGDATLATEGATVYISGWPHPGPLLTERIYQITKGNMSGRPLQSLQDGYALVYTNITRSGMSGGPVLDAEGRVVGIHGRADGEPIFNPDTGRTVNVKSGFNLGIPINGFLKLAAQNGINLSYFGDNFSLAKALTIPENTALVFAAISPDGKTIASSSFNGRIRLWNRNTGKELRTIPGHPHIVLSAAMSPDGQTLVTAHNDGKGSIKVWDLRTGELLRTLSGDSEATGAVAISPDGKTLASSGAEVNIKIWQLSTGKLLRTLEGHSDLVTSIAFSADGQTLASGSFDKTIKIWNVSTGKLLRTLEGQSHRVMSVAFSPFGQIIASGSYTGGSRHLGGGDNHQNPDEDAIKIWNWGTGELLRTLKGHSQTVSSLAFDPYGHILVSGSYDETIKIWNLYTGQLIRNLDARNSGYVSAVNHVAFSADEQIILSAGSDGQIKIWQLKE